MSDSFLMNPTPTEPAASTKPKEMKRADQRTSMTILVLGDESVGKSSLISAFVSRYFSEVVPALMTRVRMPADPRNGCVTTIVDSQQGDVALERLIMNQSHSGSASGSGRGSWTMKDEQQQQKEGTQSSQTQQPPTQNPNASATTSTTAATARLTSSAMSSSSQSQFSSTPTMSSVQNVDSIVLVEDLDRPETFYRLEHHWLPLIEQAYHGNVPVIVAENKVDLYKPSSTFAASSDEQALAHRRQQLVTLMQRFPFVRQCIKVSAKHLLRVDDVFMRAQQAVLYPFTPPLYNLKTGTLSEPCKRALTRIFRIYDQDFDGLLNDTELNNFQRDTYNVGVFARDFAAWKKVVTTTEPDVEGVVDNAFTVQGFCTIFDVFFLQNRLDVVWEALRHFNYDDDLHLHIPESVTWEAADEGAAGQSAGSSSGASKKHSKANAKGLTYWKLSSSAKHFLANTFYFFDSDKDGTLSPDDLMKIFSILPPPGLPPWHPARAKELFQGCFSVPKHLGAGSSVTALKSTDDEMSLSMILPGTMSTTLQAQSATSLLSTGDSFPSNSDVDVDNSMLLGEGGAESSGSGGALKPLTFLEWMGYWHVLSAVSPVVTREELFRLGHIEDSTSGKKLKSHESRRRGKPKQNLHSPSAATKSMPDAALKSREIRILVLGSRGCGKTALLNYLRGDTANNTRTKTTVKPETSTTCIKLLKRNKHGDSEEFIVHLVFTDVPETAAASQEAYYRQLTELFGSVTSPKDRVCDLAMLVFDSTVASSLTYAKELESTLLTKDTPRVFVGTKADRMTTDQVLDAAKLHCQEEDLEEQPLITSADDASMKEREVALQHLARCALHEPGVSSLKSRPHEEQERREAERRRRMIWLGGIVSVGVVLVVGVGWLWSSSSSPTKKDDGGSKGGSFSWLRHIFKRQQAGEATNMAEFRASKSSNNLT
ncbi:hypothetical protein MPSEU_001025200 [Mayamaea pseudoterrestris]|nr:hypothetical protein MPSEU_001025200 [Mayamaea pseudoterrestris]